MSTTFARPSARVGIIGGGFMAAVHSRAARAAGAELVGIASSTSERAVVAARSLGISSPYPSAAALIDDPAVDIVHICTPNSTHASLATAALRAGKHVVCEKPLAVDPAESFALVQHAAERHVVAAVPFVYRYHPMVQELRARVGRGDLGNVISIRGAYLQDWLLSADDANWRVGVAEGGRSRAFADIGSHLVDLLEFVTGSRITALAAATSVVHPERVGVRIETEDAAVLTARLDDGALGSLIVSQTAAGHDNDLRIEIMGTAAGASFAQERPDTLTISRPGEITRIARGAAGLSAAAQELSVVPAGHPMGYQDAFNAFVRDVYTAVDGVTPERMPTFVDGLRQTLVTEAVLASAASGQWVNVRPNTTLSENSDRKAN